jgi:hypothetical protein
VTVRQPQPWIHSRGIDGAFILGPGLAATVVSLFLIHAGRGAAELSLWTWGALIVGVDVAHVYSTIFRTYLDPAARSRLSGWLTLTPLAAWVLGVLVYSSSSALFWTLLAYIAVFHFVRQQYGFLMIYSRAERMLPPPCRWVDRIAIYAATLGPLLYWHTHLPRPFVWFVEGDFVALPGWAWTVVRPVYASILGAYFLKECWAIRTFGTVNVPRNVIVAGTAVSWYVGIVLATGDLVFTMTNVVAHGVPYLAITFIFARGEEGERRGFRPRQFVRWTVLALGLLVFLAFLEEGLWDGLVWREHLTLFPGFALLPRVESDTLLAVIVPLLAVPQLTHYVIDGVIWRLKAHPEWRRTLFWHVQRPMSAHQAAAAHQPAAGS